MKLLLILTSKYFLLIKQNPIFLEIVFSLFLYIINFLPFSFFIILFKTQLE